MRTLVSRTTLLVADIVFGLVLLGIAIAGPLVSPRSPSGAGNSEQAPPVQVTTHFGGIMPSGQSTGFAVGKDGSLAVVDRRQQVIMRLDSSGQTRAVWGPTFGAGIDAQDLVGIVSDGDGWFVLDRGASRIVRLDSQGRAQTDRTIDLSKLETYGPNGLASDGQGNLFMADTGRDRLVVFNSSGVMAGTIGDAGGDLGKFKQPMFLAFGPDGAFYVTDWENGRIQRFDASRHATNAWALPTHAWGIAVDGAGRVYVPDGEQHVVRMFGPDESLLGQITVPLDDVSQVGVSPDGARLWLLGSDGLGWADLSPFAQAHPAPPGEPVKVPLALLGVVLVLVGGLGLARLRLGIGPRPRRQTLTLVEAPSLVRVTRPLVTGVADRSAWVGGVVMVIGGVAAVVADMRLADPGARFDPWPRMAALVVASLVFAMGCVISSRAVPWYWVLERWPDCPKALISQPLERTQLVATGIVGALGALAAGVWWLGGFQTPEATRGALIWLAAIAVTVGALTAGVRVPRPTLWTLLPWALFALALVPRAYDNANLPFGVWFDEAEAGLQARKFLQTGLYTPITDTYGRDASLFYYLISAAQSVIADPVLAGRLVAAVVGAACVPLMYLLGREIFGWQVGVIAALILAAQRWHLDVSRLGWDPISLPFCAILAFWLLARAVRTGRRADAAWAGLAFGLGMHAYIGFRALPLVGLILLVYGGWRQRWPIAQFALRVGAMVGAAVLAALPVIVFAVRDPDGFNGRLSQTLILNEATDQAQKVNDIWTNLLKHVLMFHVSGDMNGRHNLPGEPMLDPASGLLLALGLGVLVARPFDWRSWLVFGWAAASLAGGIFTLPFEAPQAMRTLGVTPVLALLVGLALVLLLDRLAAYVRDQTRVTSSLAAVAACLVVVSIATTNLAMFFGRQMNDPIVWESFSTRETLPSRAALATPRPYEAILGSTTIAPSLEQQLMVPSIQNSIRAFDASTDLPYRGNGPGLIVLESEHDAGLADEVARYYRNAPRDPILPPNGQRPTADEIRLDPDVIASRRGLAASARGDGAWRSDLSLDAGGVYAFQVPPGVSLEVDGATTASGERIVLARGNHIVSLSSGGVTPTLDWEPPGSTAFDTVPDRLLFAAPDGGNGLLATFYPSTDFQGAPTDSLIDPILAHYYHVSPFARINASPPTWSAEWLGSIDAPTDGSYRFEADRLSRAGLWIDDNAVFDETADAATEVRAGATILTAGQHRIRVRLQDRGDGGPHLYLYWTPPGGDRELVPGAALFPPAPARAQ